MNIDRLEFTAWMNRIMERFDILSEGLATSHLQQTEIDGEKLLGQPGCFADAEDQLTNPSKVPHLRQTELLYHQWQAVL